MLKWKVKKSERFILGHHKQATTEYISCSRKTLEINPKNKRLTSFKAQLYLFEASYSKQDKNSRFNKCKIVQYFGSTSLNFLLDWRAKKIDKEEAATWIGSNRVFNGNCRLPSRFCNHLRFRGNHPVNNTEKSRNVWPATWQSEVICFFGFPEG